MRLDLRAELNKIRKVLLYLLLVIMNVTAMPRILVLFLFLLLTACVPNRKLLYMQKKDVNVKNLPKDTVVRTYSVDQFDYRVQTNDILSVKFESLTDKDLNFFYQNQTQGIAGGGGGAGTGPLVNGELVDNAGEIEFPVIGKVKVQGLTVFEIQEKLRELASPYIESPVVKVRVINFRITVLGEVAAEGTIILGSYRVSMLEAIAHVGGLSELADRSNIKLIRQEGGKVDIQYINPLDEKFLNSPYYYVHQNDILIVPPLRQRPFRKYFGTNLSIIVSSISFFLLVYTLSTK